MTGDITWFRPGSEVPAHLVASADGSVPDRRSTLELKGENQDLPEVGAVTDPSNFVATLVEVPPDFDETATFAAGEIVGEVTVLVQHYIDWFDDASGGTLAPGTQVVATAGGVRAFDPTAAPGANDAHSDIIGTVWYTGSDGAGTSDAVAVLRQRR